MKNLDFLMSILYPYFANKKSIFAYDSIHAHDQPHVSVPNVNIV